MALSGCGRGRAPPSEDLPDHSGLTRIRQRLGLPNFERFFELVVDVCQEAGLVWGPELVFDVTRVRADAGPDSLVPRFFADARTHVGELFGGAAARSVEEGSELNGAPRLEEDVGIRAHVPLPDISPRQSILYARLQLSNGCC